MSASIGGIFLILHTAHYTLMHYKGCKFGYYRLITKGTLLGVESIFSAVSLLQLKCLSSNFICRTLHARAIKVRLVAIGQKLSALNLENKVTFRLCLVFQWRDFPETSYSQSPRMRYTRCKFGSDRWVIKGTLLEEQVTLSSVSRLPFEGISWNFTLRPWHACATNVVSLVVIGE